MSKQRIITIFTSILVAAILGFILFRKEFFWDKMIIYFLYVALSVFFFSILVSNQKYEEDAVAKVERTGSAILFSYVIFFQLMYAPLARYIFGNLVNQRFFLSDFLALSLFLLFFFLFLILAMAINSYSRFGFFSKCSTLNNSTAYFALRNLWLAAVLLSIFLYWQMPFIIITA